MLVAEVDLTTHKGGGQYEDTGHELSPMDNAAARDGEAEQTAHPDERVLGAMSLAEDVRRSLKLYSLRFSISFGCHTGSDLQGCRANLEIFAFVVTLENVSGLLESNCEQASKCNYP